MAALWATASYWILCLFLGIFLFLGVYNEEYGHVSLRKKPKYNFNRIYHTRILEEQDISLDANERIIVVGDVHGMNNSLHKLLHSLSYQPHNDILIFAGDLLAKSTPQGSFSLLDFVTANQYLEDASISSNKANRTKKERIFAVRGNHDHLVVQWRTWRDWFSKIELHNNSSDSAYKKYKHAQDAPVANGLDFLHLLEAEWEHEKRHRESDAEEWVEVTRKRAEGTWKEKWWERIPEPGKGKRKQEWRMFGDHYWLAKEMTAEHARYITSLPLILHIPSMHFFVVHAGLLPYNTRLPPSDPRQPLTHLPPSKDKSIPDSNLDSDVPSDSDDESEDVQAENVRYMRMMPTFVVIPGVGALPVWYPDSPSTSASGEIRIEKDGRDEEILRRLQESAILHDIPQNRKWWNVLNIRTIRKSGKISRDGDRGKPWNRFWNDQMRRCKGFNLSASSFPSSSSPSIRLQEDSSGTYPDSDSDSDSYSLRCRPSTVVYGHAASRGLDLKRWSKGLDTGCLYGRRLTSLVLSHTDPGAGSTQAGDTDETEEDAERRKKKGWGERTKFGEDDSGIWARIHSIRCQAPDLEQKPQA
ncbi:unnamed protein product [Somion occarium]|uniref:Calcineurin-like phosphoesterase domain-containing protein n=1 Tax=Somion occarium TaxID=3059160 RepID=A0ABP1CX86_9APHY